MTFLWNMFFFFFSSFPVLERLLCFQMYGDLFFLLMSHLLFLFEWYEKGAAGRLVLMDFGTKERWCVDMGNKKKKSPSSSKPLKFDLGIVEGKWYLQLS